MRNEPRLTAGYGCQVSHYVGRDHRRRRERGNTRMLVLEAIVFALAVITLLAWLGILAPAVPS